MPHRDGERTGYTEAKKAFAWKKLSEISFRQLFWYGNHRLCRWGAPSAFASSMDRSGWAIGGSKEPK